MAEKGVTVLHVVFELEGASGSSPRISRSYTLAADGELALALVNDATLRRMPDEEPSGMLRRDFERAVKPPRSAHELPQ